MGRLLDQMIVQSLYYVEIDQQHGRCTSQIDSLVMYDPLRLAR